MAFVKKLKKYKIIFLLLSSFIIGFIFVLLVYAGIWSKFTQSLASIHFIFYLLLFLLTFYLTLTLHELGHFLSFYFQKVNLRAIYLTIFIFYKTKSGWKFRIKPKLWFLLGGLVVPDLGLIKNDDDYENISKKFANSLIFAPIVTISFLVLMIITFVITLAYSNNFELIGVITIVTFYTILLSTLYIYSFSLSNQMFYGDFIAYKKMKSDPIFRLAQITQYQMFSLNDLDDENNLYIFNKIRLALRDITITQNLFHTMLLIHYLDGVVRKNYPIDLNIDIKLRRLNVRPYLKKEEGLTLAYDLSNYFYKIKDVQKAYQMFELINQMKYDKLDQKMVEYYRRKNMHIMHIEYQDEFLSHKENIYVGSNFIFEAFIDPFEDIDQYHEKLEFVCYQTIVDLVKEEDKEIEA
jgi:membrane-associated protease RseP (regulator of RpoE activity)